MLELDRFATEDELSLLADELSTNSLLDSG
jgi:hypothetical protein